MHEEKIVRGISGSILILPILFVIVFAFFGYGVALSVLLYLLACTVIAVALARLLGHKPALLQIFLAAAIPAALAFAVPVTFPQAWFVYIMMALGVLFSLWVERRTVTTQDGQPLTTDLMLPVATFLAACTILWFSTRSSGADGASMWTALAILGSVWFVLAAFMLNRSSLRLVARARSHKEIPPGARRAGLIGTVVFIVLAFLFSLISAIGRAMADAFHAAGQWLIMAYLWLINHLLAKNPVDTPSEGGGDQGMFPAAPDTPMPLWEQIILYTLAVLIFLGVIALIIYGIYKGAPRLWKYLQDRFKTLFETWQDSAQEYDDKNESLMSLKQALVQAGQQLNKFVRRFRRKPRLTDCATNSDKARFLFRALLDRLRERNTPPPPGATPAEITAAYIPAEGMAELSRSYNLARYAEEEPQQSDIEKAAKGMEIR